MIRTFNSENRIKLRVRDIGHLLMGVIGIDQTDCYWKTYGIERACIEVEIEWELRSEGT
jgi:hypothetical protein